jgi:hypothetical protein
MHRARPVICLGTLSLVLSVFCGCTSSRSLWEEWFPPKVPTLANNLALDRALHLSSLTEGDQPFHLILAISPPPHQPDKFAQIEIYWLNPITYRTQIHSRTFSQTRIVNGRVIDEHNTGDFYPRWIQNFVDAILNPVSDPATLRKIPGAIPIGPQSQACISTIGSADPGPAQVCLTGSEPKLTSARDATHYVSFDDFQPFGSQLIPRTLVESLPENTLIRAQIVLLEPLSPTSQRQLKATEFTQSAKQIRTALVPATTAQSLLDFNSANKPSSKHNSPSPPLTPLPVLQSDPQNPGPIKVYIRTDRTGRVREAYRDNSNHMSMQSSTSDPAAARALALKFRPYLVNGVPQQMESTIALPTSSR